MENKKTYGMSIQTLNDDFVLEKNIFSNVFEKDIRKVYLYKKAERLAKAIHLITPAFADSVSLKSRLDLVAIRLVEAALLPLGAARGELARELLTLSSVLHMAKTGGMLSLMNSEMILKETHLLLQEVASYEEPRLTFEDVPSLSDIAKRTTGKIASNPVQKVRETLSRVQKGHIKDSTESGVIKDRREAILSVIKDKQRASIKDISTLIRNVSEKTIQRELIALISSGVIVKEGERRWSVYSLAV